MKRGCALAVVAACGGAPAHVATQPTNPKAAAPAAPTAVDWSKLVGPIQSVDVKSSDAALVPAARDALAAEVGKPIDRARLRSELTKVLTSHSVSDVQAKGVQLADGIRLEVTLVPQPTVHAFSAHEAGGTEIPLPGQLATAVGLPLDPAAVGTVVVELRDRYLERGYLDVSVDWTAKPVAGPAQVDISLDVVPGVAVVVSTVDFHGNAHAKKAELVKAIAGNVLDGSPWMDDHIERARTLIIAYYYDHGYILATVDSPKPAGDHSPAVFQVHEGDQFKLGKLEIRGVPAGEAKKDLGIVGVKHGDIVSRTAITSGIQKLQDVLKAGGMTKPIVTPDTHIDSAKKVVDLMLDVQKG